jgi:hypothetical protein
MIQLPQIVYLQTITDCNGHCRYCPFDDIYGEQEPESMSLDVFCTVIEWLQAQRYRGRVGFLLHYEPTMDPGLNWRLEYARKVLPGIRLEVATNGVIDDPVLNDFDIVDCVPAGSRMVATSRAGNCRATPETTQRLRLAEPPCIVPAATMPIAANGNVLLCCQDWRHEAVVGTYEDLTAARLNQLRYAKKAWNQELEICRDCMAGETAEEVGERLGKRSL